MWIENVSKADILNGNYPDPGENSMLIQIIDPATFPPVPKYTDFTVIRSFDFSDVDNPDDEVWPFRMNDEQAKAIAFQLKFALKHEMNVIVHCVAGLCRSGAVTEVALMIGFDGGNTPRQPNVHVKKMLMQEFDLIPDYNDVFKEIQ